MSYRKKRKIASFKANYAGLNYVKQRREHNVDKRRKEARDLVESL